MDRFTDSFNEHAESLRIERDLAERKDYGAALSGSDIGRQRKHILGNDINPLTGKKKKDAIAEALQKTLEDMLLNPQYRLAHENLMNDLRDTQNEAQSALGRVMDELSIARSAMNDLLSNAAKLPDGTKVFRDKDGQVWNEEGEIIPPELAATIEWRGNEPSYEDYIIARQRIDTLETAQRELRGIEAELGDIHEKATSNDNPYSQDGLGKAQNRVDDLRKRLESIQDNLSPDVKHEAKADIEVNQAPQTSSITIPMTNFGKSN